MPSQKIIVATIQNYGERLLSQFIGALIMIAVGGGGAFITYLILYLLPIRPVAWIFEKYKIFSAYMYIAKIHTDYAGLKFIINLYLLQVAMSESSQ